MTIHTATHTSQCFVWTHTHTPAAVCPSLTFLGLTGGVDHWRKTHTTHDFRKHHHATFIYTRGVQSCSIQLPVQLTTPDTQGLCPKSRSPTLVHLYSSLERVNVNEWVNSAVPLNSAPFKPTGRFRTQPLSCKHSLTLEKGCAVLASEQPPKTP